ncbi:MAG: tryptophan--tRNA ligase, partial [Candidatus Wolfebacteria bacterium]|nr:tryptophan--tRNA ligase [Candidatus Wolfebacteria bacterium]
PVFVYHDAFNPNKKEVEDMKVRYREGGISDMEVKKRLAEALNDFLNPIRERRAMYQKNIDEVEKLLLKGTERGRFVAAETLKAVRKAMKINYFD